MSLFCNSVLTKELEGLIEADTLQDVGGYGEPVVKALTATRKYVVTTILEALSKQLHGATPGTTVCQEIEESQNEFYDKFVFPHAEKRFKVFLQPLFFTTGSTYYPISNRIPGYKVVISGEVVEDALRAQQNQDGSLTIDDINRASIKSFYAGLIELWGGTF